MTKLNIGCGPNIFPYDEWINYDKHTIHPIFLLYARISSELERAKKYNIQPHLDCLKEFDKADPEGKKLIDFMRKGGKITFHTRDVRERFDHYIDNSIEFIYCGQMIEHINPFFKAPPFLQDCYRMLKPGGFLRLTTPDLELLINAYNKNEMMKFANDQPRNVYDKMDPLSQLAMIMYGTTSETCTQENYEGHQFLFNKTSITLFLEAAGFKTENIKFYHTAQQTASGLGHEFIDKGMSHSFAVEAQK